MPTRRQIQVAEEIQQIISVLLQRELKDPGIGFVSITQVDVTQDLKYARVHVSVMGSEEEKRDTMAALERARGFIRREIASRMTIRQVPEIQFRLDRGLEYSDRINRLLNELKEAEAETGVVGEVAGEVAAEVAAEVGTEVASEVRTEAEAEEQAEHTPGSRSRGKQTSGGTG
jgi:ribosome-binding factor A